MASDNLEVFDLDDKEVDLLSFEPSPSLSKLSVNPDQIQHFEEFMDEVSKPPAKCWELGYYQPFFDIETETVLTRLKRAIVPKSDFFEGGSPDLYSPFWIVTTLIFIIGVSSNADLLTRNDQWAPQISIVFSAASFLYCLTAAVPLGYFFLLQYAGQKSEFVPMLSLYAYSFLLYIPTLILCIIDYFLLRLAVLAATTCWAVSFLLCNQWSDLQHLPTNIKWVGVGLLAGGHFLFALVCLFCFLATA